MPVMRRGEVVTVHNPNRDDFGSASKHVELLKVDEHYSYQHRNIFWQLASFLFYYIIIPIPALFVAAWCGMRLVDRRTVRRLGGCFMYANHTNWADIWIPYLLSFPKRAYIVTGPTAVSVPIAKHVVPMVGGIPLNTTPAGKEAFRSRLADLVRRGHPVAIFPEAHIWPFYNGIRDFSPYSFTYPVHDASPVVPYVITYRPRRWLKWRRPCLTVTVGDPIHPETWAGSANPKQVVRDKVHDFMCETVRARHSLAWVTYQIGDGAEPS